MLHHRLNLAAPIVTLYQCKCEILTVDFFFQQCCRMEKSVSSMQKSPFLEKLKDKISQFHVTLPRLETGGTSVNTNLKTELALNCIMTVIKQNAFLK